MTKALAVAGGLTGGGYAAERTAAPWVTEAVLFHLLGHGVTIAGLSALLGLIVVTAAAGRVLVAWALALWRLAGSGARAVRRWRTGGDDQERAP